MNEILEAVRSRLLFDDSGEFEKALLQLLLANAEAELKRAKALAADKKDK